MSWLLRRRIATRTNASTPDSKWDKELTLRRLLLLVSALILTGLYFGWKYGHRELVMYVGSIGQRFTLDKVELVNPPAWLHADIQTDLRRMVATQVTMDPLDAGCLQNAVSTLAANPWVEGVEKIERTSGGLRIEARFRVPVAAVMLPRKPDHEDDYLRRTDLFHLIDASGRRLPSDSTGRGDQPYSVDQVKAFKLPVIVGVKQSPATAGAIWPGEDVQAGLSLMNLLQPEQFARQIVAYDVSRRDTRGRVHLALRTLDGLVQWGLAPGQEKAVEPDARVKLHLLRGVYAHHKSIDAGGKQVSVFGATASISQREEPFRVVTDLKPGATRSTPIQQVRGGAARH